MLVALGLLLPGRTVAPLFLLERPPQAPDDDAFRASARGPADRVPDLEEEFDSSLSQSVRPTCARA